MAKRSAGTNIANGGDFSCRGDAGIGAGKFTLALAEKFSGVQKINDHPDILLVRPEKNIIRIRPDGKFKEPTIHDLIVFCALKPTTLTHRIALILEAEKMNRHAANALLKTLEEPEGKKIIILWAKSAQLLPATIVSRCRLVTAPRPDTKTAKRWMAESGFNQEATAFAGGQPLAANNDYETKRKAAVKALSRGGELNIHTAAKIFADDDIWLECLQKWAADGVRVAAALPARFFPDAKDDLRPLCHKRLRPWLDFHALLIKKRRWHDHPLARDILIKDILHEYRRIFAD